MQTSDVPMKIPVEYLLKRSRQECGELKSYVQELEHENSKLKKILQQFRSEDKEWSKEVKKEELYKQIQAENKKLRQSVRDHKNLKNRLIYELTQLRLKYESTSV